MLPAEGGSEGVLDLEEVVELRDGDDELLVRVGSMRSRGSRCFRSPARFNSPVSCMMLVQPLELPQLVAIELSPDSDEHADEGEEHRAVDPVQRVLELTGRCVERHQRAESETSCEGGHQPTGYPEGDAAEHDRDVHQVRVRVPDTARAVDEPGRAHDQDGKPRRRGDLSSRSQVANADPAAACGRAGDRSSRRGCVVWRMLTAVGRAATGHHARPVGSPGGWATGTTSWTSVTGCAG